MVVGIAHAMVVEALVVDTLPHHLVDTCLGQLVDIYLGQLVLVDIGVDT